MILRIIYRHNFYDLQVEISMKNMRNHRKRTLRQIDAKVNMIRGTAVKPTWVVDLISRSSHPLATSQMYKNKESASIVFRLLKAGNVISKSN